MLIKNPLRAYRRARKAFRAFNRLRKYRKERKQQIQEVTGKDEPVKEFIVKKARGAMKSSTVGLASLVIAAGAWAQANPEFWNLVPEQWRGVALAILGLLVAIARARSLGR